LIIYLIKLILHLIFLCYVINKLKMIDPIMNISFQLDYEIFHTTSIGSCAIYLNNLNKIKTSLKDIQHEYYEFLDSSKQIISELIQLLNICDEQRRV
jgi:hypothetical protein